MKSPLLKVDVLKRKWRNSIMATGTLWIASDMQIISWRADISLSIHGKTKKFLAMVQTAPVANHPSAYDLVLSTLCFQDESVRYLVGKQFTAQSIKGATQKGHAVISGTTLLGQAQLVLRNWKKALAYGAEFLLPDGSLCYGMDTADYFNHVLKEMYHHLNVTATATAILDDNGDEDDND